MPNDALERLRRANPVPSDLSAPPLGPLLDRLEETPVRPGAAMSLRGRPRRARVVGALALTLAVAVVVLVAAVAFRTAANGRRALTGSTARAHSSIVVLRAEGPGGDAPVGQAVQRAVVVLGKRLTTISSRLHVSRTGADQISIAGVSPRDRAQVLRLTRPGRLLFYDWEADALTSDGKTVATQLASSDPEALQISQGTSSGPGLPGGGSVSLYQAVKLASKQAVVQAGRSEQLSRQGPEYYLFGSPGSPACAAAANHDMTAEVQGEPCLLAGPSTNLSDLRAGLPPGVRIADGQRLTVPQGTVVLQATDPSANNQINSDSPAAQFYVLKDDVSLTGSDITNPRQSTDQSGRPDVTFDFNSSGNSRFQKATARIAHRGAVTSTETGPLDQHFAVALDTQLLTVPSIDYKVYPGGITGGAGADITGPFTHRTAAETAALLRSGVLPVSLTTR